MVKKRFDVEVPDGKHLGLSRGTDGAYRGHLFDDETNELVGHAELHEVDEINAGSPPVFDYGTNEDKSDSEEPRLHEVVAEILPIAIVAAVKTAQYIKSRRENKKSTRNKISATRGADSQAAIATVVPAGWYVDASDATRLHYWDGTAWTHHFTPRSRIAATPAPVTPTSHTPATRPLEESKISMSSEEWQELVLAWLKAGTIGEELWRLISNAHIKDADLATLESQREMEKLTAQQGVDRIKFTLEANPSLHDEDALTECLKLFGRGRNVDRQYVPLRNEAINETPRLTDGEL